MRARMLCALVVMAFLILVYTDNYVKAVQQSDTGYTPAPTVGDTTVTAPLPTTSTLTTTLMPGEYIISGNGVVSISSSNSKTTMDILMSTILKQKQQSLVAELDLIVRNNFFHSEINTGVYMDSGSILHSNLNVEWGNRTDSITFYLGAGSSVYKFKTTAGDASSRAYAILAINKYTKMVKDTVAIHLYGSSFNLYSVIPSKPVPITTILEDVRDGNNNVTGNKSIKSSGSGVKLDYILTTFNHPIFGVIPATDMGESVEDKKVFLESKSSSMEFQSTASPDKMIFPIDSDYSYFVKDVTNGKGIYSKVDSASVVGVNAVTNAKLEYTSKTIDIQSATSTLFPLAMPKTFLLDNNGGTTYKLSTSRGYALSDKHSLMITASYVYEKTETGTNRIGDFGVFGINPQGLALMGAVVNEDGTVGETGTTATGKRIAVVVPLWFKEVVLDTFETQGDVLYTGRTIKLSNDFNSKLRIDSVNSDLLAFDTKVDATTGISLRRFAFGEGVDERTKEGHRPLGTLPNELDLKVLFDGNPESDYRGFFIVRNNSTLSDDKALMAWLKKDAASALTDVDTERLLKLMSGSFELENKTITYSEWLRLQEIKDELDISLKDRILHYIGVALSLFGMFIMIYSVLMVLVYWFDILNTFTTFSILYYMSGKHLNPVPYKDVKDFYVEREGARYVTFFDMIVLMAIGIVVGALFIYSTPIVRGILWLFSKLG